MGRGLTLFCGFACWTQCVLAENLCHKQSIQSSVAVGVNDRPSCQSGFRNRM